MGLFAKKITASRKGHLYEIHALDATGTKAYYFVLVDKMKLQPFKAALKANIFNIANYGRVLAKGFGHNPPASIRENALSQEGW